jgi:phosphoribosylformylglycinamidine synthase
MDLKRAGDPLYVVGMTHPELGGSQYLQSLGLDGGRVPRPDLALAPKHLRALFGAISSGCVRACHDLSEGGLAVAAAEMAFAGELGLELDLARMVCAANLTGFDLDTTRLFSESCTRFLVEVDANRAADFERRFAGLDCARVGSVASNGRVVVRGVGATTRIDQPLDALRRAHRGGFQG